MDEFVKTILISYLLLLELAVKHLSILYEDFPELNDQVDIQKIIPMSLDEWKLEIASKVDEIEKTI